MQPDDAPLWSIVDPAWYRAFYPVVEALAGGQDEAAVTDVYHRLGQPLGHSPNPYFVESWYLARNPDVRATFAAGGLPSGFSHFCEFGHADRAPHWLFDPAFYREQYEMKHGTPFAAETLGVPYTHFLRHGQFEGLSGHFLFDPSVYEALSSHETIVAIRENGAFSSYVARLGLEPAEPVATNLFNPGWYIARYPEVREGIEDATWTSALEHYLTNDTPDVYDPSPLFSEAAYLAAHADVREAVARGDVRNGYEHYRINGRLELRQFFPAA
jgi:hypothetical protein